LNDNGPNPASAGQAVSFTVNVTGGAADGETVNLEDASNGNAIVGSGTLAGGSAPISVSNLPAGAHSLFAVYPGDASHQTSQSVPTAQTIVGLASAAQSTLTLAAMCPSGTGCQVTLVAKDAAGNQELSGGLNVSFSLAPGSTGSGGFSAVTDHGDGTYTAIFTGTTLGKATVTASIGINPVTATAPTTIVPGNFSSAVSTITPSSTTDVSGTSVTVTLTTRDASGNQLPGGGLNVTFALGTGSATGTFSAVTDNHDGTYTATFTGLTAGSATVTASVGGNTLTSTAPILTVIPGAISAAESTIAVSATSLAVGGSTTITLTARDAAGNLISRGGDSVIFSASSGAGSISGVTDKGNGRYTATFFGSSAGNVTIIAQVNGQTLAQAPPTVTVNTLPITVQTPPTIAAVHGTATIRVVFTNLNSTTPVSVKVTTSLGNLTVHSKGVNGITVRGNNSRGLTVTGTPLAIKNLLAKLQVVFGKHHGKAAVKLTLLQGGVAASARFSVKG
jgi:adhesin/invasin